MDYKALSVFVAAFLSVGVYSNSSRLASAVCLTFIGAMLLIDTVEYLMRRKEHGK